MSSISSFNSSSTNLYQLFSNLASSSAAGGSASASASGSASASNEILALLASQQIDGAEPSTGDSSTTDGADPTTGSTNSTNSTGSSNSSSGSNVSLSSLRQQIETAVTDAIDNLSSAQLADPGATAQAVKQAVSQTLQQNGIDPTQLSATSSDPTSSSDTTPASFGSAAGAAHHAAGAGGSGGGSSTSSTGAASGGTSASATGSLLDQLLSANNVDPTDFQNNLLSAISGAQNGEVDFSQLFQNFPSGQDIDAVA